MTEAIRISSWPPLLLPGTRTGVMRSEVNGEQYQITIWQPPGEVPTAGFPVIYVLDAGSLFATFVDTLRRSSKRPDATGIRPALVVGIDPAPDGVTRNTGRYRDFTAGPSNLEPATGSVHGGAPTFHRFLETELVPLVERELPADAIHRGLFGHSLGGYFCLWSLLTRTQSFSHYFAISPSIWWDANVIQRELMRFRPQRHTPHVYVAVGSWEGSIAPWQLSSSTDPAQIRRRAQRAMTVNARAFAHELGSLLPPDRLRFDLLQDEDHSSVIGPAIGRALRFMWGA